MATMKDQNLVPMSPVVRRPRANTIAESQPSRTMDKPNAARDCCSSGSFVTKLYKMVDSEPTTIVSWIRGGTAFCIVDPKMMAEHCLPKYFRHRRFSSLIRQLNFYSFYRVQEGQLTIYQHSYFRKGRPDLLVHIKRRGAGKAKDPWFDPLVSSKPPMPMPMSVGQQQMNNVRDVRLSSLPELPAVQTSGIMCYSPMAKPLVGSIDNMSPALKPGMAHMSPPVVDLGGNAMAESEKFLETHRWGNALIDLQEQPGDFNALLKPEPSFSGELSTVVATSGLMKQTAPSTNTSIDIDIQDFLTDDCSINATLSDKCSTDDHGASFMSNNVIPAKRAFLARDCLKWESKNDVNTPREATTTADDDATFEQELLLDLANVEPGAWEVPLSPLNEEEDVMPWLDLCF